MNTDNQLVIRELIEKWAKAVREEDMEGILAHHAEDMVMFDVPLPLQSKGLEEYKKTWELFFSWTKKSRVYNITELEIVAGDEVAFCHGLGHCQGEDSKGVKESLIFRLTMGFCKVDGQWVIKHEHHSLPNT